MLFFLISAIGRFLNQDNSRDKELLIRIAAKDPVALSLLYDQYNRLLFGLLVSILKKKEEAEDILQEVFTNIWEKADQYDPEKGSAYTWIVSLTRNKGIDRLRSKVYKEQKKQSTSLDNEDTYMPLFSEENNPLEDAILSDRASMLKEALAKISEKQRTVLQVAYFDGLTQTEISEQLDIPLGTVKSRMRDGMLKLREILSGGLA
ncbi:sigma-70 family RNA polymerase sigma factor [Balneola vulgaris]|jgi:RNA polymerase sigma-70 factor (ECF subfamily)|uniref:sigma-70 family RNA polymerase sigma factor n=1 Tax=Balneola vulgaris TaxID=287535 RepID=UPI000364F7D9|nr:sigma-70 family RNA polymerase sigma factor [Balneola vulgaris]